MSEHEHVAMANYASYLRDVADRDYIAARASLRATLPDNFLWSALQSIEKYLKSTILYNILYPIKQYSHVIFPLINLIEQSLGIVYNLESDELGFLQYIEKYGPGRYADTRQQFINDDIYIFDAIIWEIRRNCQHLNHSNNVIYTKSDVLNHIKRVDIKNEGYLERILTSSHEILSFQRELLLWNNPIFGGIIDNTFVNQAIIASCVPPWDSDLDLRCTMQKYVRLKKID